MNSTVKTKKRIVPFKAEHLLNFRIQDAQIEYEDYVAKHPDYAVVLEHSTYAYTALVDDEVIAVAGVTMIHPRCAHAWSLLGINYSKHKFFIIKEIKKFIERHIEFARIQVNIPCEFPEGHRLISLFGFVPEGIMKKYGEDGRDHMLYARIR